MPVIALGCGGFDLGAAVGLVYEVKKLLLIGL